jgi:hypothetical protein
MTKIIQFNVGGMRYDIAEETLLNHADTMLAKLVSSKWKKGGNQEPLFIDRDGERFRYILDWYRDGQIIVPKTIPVSALRNDALFFGLPDDVVIEETQSFGDYVSLFHGTVTRFQSLRISLLEMIQKNVADGIVVNIENCAIWAILELLNNMTSTAEMSEIVIVSLSDYKNTLPAFSIEFSQKDVLLAAVNKIFARLGDELLPSFTVSAEATVITQKKDVLMSLFGPTPCVAKLVFTFAKN